MTVMKPKNHRTELSVPGEWRRMSTALSLAGVMLGATACHTETPTPTPTPQTLTESAQKGLDILGFKLDVTSLAVADQELIGRGSYLVNAVGECSGCHNANGPSGTQYLGGGTAYAIGPGAVVYARNLTPDPDKGMKLTEDQFVEVMRTGKDYSPNAGSNEALIVMPWMDYRWMSTEDLKSIYAYLTKVPAVSNSVPADIKGSAAAARPVAYPSSFTDGDVARDLPSEDGEYPSYASRGLAVQPLADPSALAGFSDDDRATYGRGSYLVNAVAGCNDCHTNPDRNRAAGPSNGKITTSVYLTGGRVFAVPAGLNRASGYSRSMSANLLGASHSRLPDSYESFRDIMATGKVAGPEPRRAISFPMATSAVAYAKMLDGDLQAIYFYLKTQTRLTGAADKQIQAPTHYCAADTDCASYGGTCSLGGSTGINQCVGSACTQDTDCGACQTCTSGTCAAPSSSSTCPASGI